MKTIIIIIYCILFPSIVFAINLTKDEEIVFDEINKYRVENNLAPAKINKQTCQYAKKRAKDQEIKFSHEGFGGKEMWENYYKDGLMATENLAYQYEPDEVVSAWTNSPAHKANLLDNTQYICVANVGKYWVMEGLKK